MGSHSSVAEDELAHVEEAYRGLLIDRGTKVVRKASWRAMTRRIARRKASMSSFARTFAAPAMW